MGDETSTDVHPATRRRREAAKQTGLTALVTAVLLGVPSAVVRSRDVDRIESRQDKTEEQTRANSASIIELNADSRNQGEKIDRIVLVVDQVNAKLDSIRDRLPR